MMNYALILAHYKNCEHSFRDLLQKHWFWIVRNVFFVNFQTNFSIVEIENRCERMIVDVFRYQNREQFDEFFLCVSSWFDFMMLIFDNFCQRHRFWLQFVFFIASFFVFFEQSLSISSIFTNSSSITIFFFIRINHFKLFNCSSTACNLNHKKNNFWNQQHFFFKSFSIIINRENVSIFKFICFFHRRNVFASLIVVKTLEMIENIFDVIEFSSIISLKSLTYN